MLTARLVYLVGITVGFLAVQIFARPVNDASLYILSETEGLKHGADDDIWRVRTPRFAGDYMSQEDVLTRPLDKMSITEDPEDIMYATFVAIPSKNEDGTVESIDWGIFGNTIMKKTKHATKQAL